MSGGLTPRGEETLVRLASWMPFEQAREVLQDLVGIQVSKATARRATLQTGEAALAVAEAEEERLQQEMPQAPAGAEKQALSADGAFVHLVGGEWVEVKTLYLGRSPAQARGSLHAAAFHLFAALWCRALCGSSTGGNASAGVGTGGSGLRGARWRGVAARVGRLPLCGCGAYPGLCPCCRICQSDRRSRASSRRQTAHRLARWRAASAQTPGTRARAHAPDKADHSLSQRSLQEHLTYLQKRAAQMQYPTYQAAGWPIGSGSVESANKIVVEARLKGAGMRWGRQNVNPMLVLRNGVCNQRWNETWTAAGASGTRGARVGGKQTASSA